MKIYVNTKYILDLIKLLWTEPHTVLALTTEQNLFNIFAVGKHKCMLQVS